MKGILSILLLFLILYETSANGSENNIQDDYADYNENIYKKYVMMDKELKTMAEQGVKRLLPYLLEAREHLNISMNCTKNLFDLITGLRKLTNWSFNFLDAMGKMQSGLQAGNLQMFGEYEECIDTTVTKKGKVDFQGQYCNVIVKPFLPKVKKIPGLNGRLEGLVNATRNTSDFMQQIVSRAHAFYAFEINLGLCIPSGCSKHDVSEILKYSIGNYLNTTVSQCLKKGDIYFWTTTRIIIVSVFVLLGVLLVISTWLDNTLETWKSKQLGFKTRILQCFSLTRNFPRLMNTDVSEKSITCLYGIRVLTIFWIILGHEFFIHAMALTANHVTNYEKMLSKFFSQITLNGFVSVEMFFFMSGFVNCYLRMLIHNEGRPQPGIGKMILHRLWRIYPAYIVAFLVLHLLNKPHPFSYKITSQHKENCNLYWWRSFLFINNFFDPFKVCMAQSWFIAVDMQLFLVTLFTIPLFFRKHKKAIILHVGIIILVNLCSMSWWLLDDSIGPATLDGTRLDSKDQVKAFHIYILPPVHVGSYIIGILLGYIIATKKNIKIPKVTQLFGWLAASLFFTSMIFMTLRWNSGTPYTMLDSSLYGAWSRTILVLGFSWLVFCCATGHSPLINYILSLKLWIPLSRITYMIFLISPLIQAHYYTHANFPEDFSDIRIIWNYFADVSISILMSFALVLLVESPLIAMEKILFRRNSEKNNLSSEAPKELKENGSRNNNKIEHITIHL